MKKRTKTYEDEFIKLKKLKIDICSKINQTKDIEELKGLIYKLSMVWAVVDYLIKRKLGIEMPEHFGGN